jgi:hypothetical protein
MEFASHVVQHEYIVQFKNYYQKEARANFLRAALDNAEVILSINVIITCVSSRYYLVR